MPDRVTAIREDATGAVSQPKNTLVDTNSEDCIKSVVPDYAVLFFDHLYSEYLTLRSNVDDQGVIAVLETIYNKRTRCQLTWSDIYTFDLASSTSDHWRA